MNGEGEIKAGNWESYITPTLQIIACYTCQVFAEVHKCHKFTGSKCVFKEWTFDAKDTLPISLQSFPESFPVSLFLPPPCMKDFSKFHPQSGLLILSTIPINPSLWITSWHCWASLVAQRLKRLPAIRERWVRSLGQEDHLEKEMATHSSVLAWRIPWTEEPGRLQSMGSQRVGNNWAASLSLSWHC